VSCQIACGRACESVDGGRRGGVIHQNESSASPTSVKPNQPAYFASRPTTGPSYSATSASRPDAFSWPLVQVCGTNTPGRPVPGSCRSRRRRSPARSRPAPSPPGGRRTPIGLQSGGGVCGRAAGGPDCPRSHRGISASGFRRGSCRGRPSFSAGVPPSAPRGSRAHGTSGRPEGGTGWRRGRRPSRRAQHNTVVKVQTDSTATPRRRNGRNSTIHSEALASTSLTAS